MSPVRGPMVSLVSLVVAWLSLAACAGASELPSRWTTALLHLDCPARTVASFRAGAARGDAAALEALGLANIRGCGMTQDMHAAGALFDRAVAHGARDPFARGYVAYARSAGAAGADFDAAHASFETALAAGDPFAAEMLAWMEFYKLPFPDERAAYAFEVRAANGGDYYGIANRGSDLMEGVGTEADPKAGLALLLAHRTVQATYHLGYAYVYPSAAYGLPPGDVAHGLDLMKRAAAAGSGRAKFNLVVYYREHHDYGILRDNAESWLADVRKLIPESDGDLQLGYLLSNGYGLARDGPRAIELFRKGAALGNLIGVEDVAIDTLAGRDGVKADWDAGMRMLQDCANRGSAQAKRDLAFILQNDYQTVAVPNEQPYYPDPNNPQNPVWQRQHPIGTLPLPGSAGSPTYGNPY